MIILKREWKRNRKTLFIWTITISLLLLIMMSVYPTFAKNNEMMQNLLQFYPESMLNAFGLDTLNMANILDYFSIEAYLFLTLFGSIYAALLSSNILSKEENDKTIEFLLAKPVTRTQIITSKLIIVLINILIFNLINGIVAIISFEMYKTTNYDFNTLILLILGSFLMHLTFASLTLLFSVFYTKTKSIYSISIGIVLITYFLSIVANISEKFNFFRYFTPFKYIEASEIISAGRIDPFYLLLITTIIIVGICSTYFLYNKKNITV